MGVRWSDPPAWAQEPEDRGIFRGVLIGLPISLALWALIVLAIVGVFR